METPFLFAKICVPEIAKVKGVPAHPTSLDRCDMQKPIEKAVTDKVVGIVSSAEIGSILKTPDHDCIAVRHGRASWRTSVKLVGGASGQGHRAQQCYGLEPDHIDARPNS